MKEFSGLDGKGFDNRPITRRKEAVVQPLTIESIFDLDAYKKEDGSFDNELVSVERYAFSSFLIEAMWSNLKQQSDTYSKETTSLIPLTENFWKEFSDHYIKVVQAEQATLDKNAELALKKPEEEMTFIELATLRYLYLVKASTGERGLPSFIDFISIYTRLARVVEELGGEQISRAHFEQALAHPSFRNMMLEMMMNSRDAGYFQLAALEGGVPNTDDTSRKFDSLVFDTNGAVETGNFHITPDPEIHAKVKQRINDMFRRKQAEGTAPAVFRCPVIYTGIFTEMCDWMKHEFTQHYLNQRFD